MDLRGLGALLTALGGVFTAKTGAKAGQLQGLLMGEDLTERRKRMKMAEEAHQLQTELARSEEKRRAEIHPLTMEGLQQQIRQSEQLFPYKQDLLATQTEKAKLDLTNTRLWSLYQQGVVPSQITDPVLRAQYEPFFNFQLATKSLEVVETNEDLEAVLGKVPEELRPTLELWGRSHLLTNQSKRQMTEKYMKGVDINIAQGEFQLRSLKLQTALNTILNNINNEGMDWDKRSSQQKIEAVKKWIAQLGLEDVVPEDFANMFQRVKSIDARQFALYQAQLQLQHRMQADLLRQQFGYNLNLLQHGWWNNIVAGALGLSGGQGGFGNTAPVGFMQPPAPANIFTPTPNQQGSYLNQTALNNYLKPPIDVPIPYGNGTTMLGALRGNVQSIYNQLARGNADITADQISTLITYDAGLQFASAQQAQFPLDWNTALMLGVQNILPVLKSHPAYRTNMNYQRTVNEYERAWERKLQEMTGSGAQNPASNAPTGQIGRPPNAPVRQGGQTPQRPPAQPPAPRSGGGTNYTSSARKKRE